MGVGDVWRRVVKLLVQQHGPVKSFEHEISAAGGVAGRVDAGMKTVPTSKVVGSVGRWQNLRSDFFYVSGKVTGRFVRIGKAMEEGKVLPPIEVYKAKLRRRQGNAEREITEYYVVDGHHRVAMAKKLGQDFLDAHVVEHKVGSAGTSDAPNASGIATPPTPPMPLTPAPPATLATPATPATPAVSDAPTNPQPPS